MVTGLGTDLAARHDAIDRLAVDVTRAVAAKSQELEHADAEVAATPGTHAIFAQLKAGETVYQTGELPKTFRVSKLHYMYEPPKTVCETPFASIFPPSMENGDGTRRHRRPPAGRSAPQALRQRGHRHPVSGTSSPCTAC